MYSFIKQKCKTMTGYTINRFFEELYTKNYLNTQEKQLNTVHIIVLLAEKQPRLQSVQSWVAHYLLFLCESTQDLSPGPKAEMDFCMNWLPTLARLPLWRLTCCVSASLSPMSFLLSCGAADRCMMSLSPQQVEACFWQNNSLQLNTSLCHALPVSVPFSVCPASFFKRSRCHFGARLQSYLLQDLHGGKTVIQSSWESAGESNVGWCSPNPPSETNQ